MTGKSKKPLLFNSPLEAGMRAVIILECFAPEQLDITTLSLLDYFVVHTADVGGPPSLHPNLEARAGEYFVRRSLVEAGALMMTRADLLERVADKNGISYRSRERTTALIDMMASEYNLRIHEAAEWLSNQSHELGLAEFFDFLKSGVDGHLHEIHGNIGS